MYCSFRGIYSTSRAFCHAVSATTRQPLRAHQRCLSQGVRDRKRKQTKDGKEHGKENSSNAKFSSNQFEGEHDWKSWSGRHFANPGPEGEDYDYGKPLHETYGWPFGSENADDKSGTPEKNFDGSEVTRISDVSILDDLLNNDDDVNVTLTVKDGKLVMADSQDKYEHYWSQEKSSVSGDEKFPTGFGADAILSSVSNMDSACGFEKTQAGVVADGASSLLPRDAALGNGRKSFGRPTKESEFSENYVTTEDSGSLAEPRRLDNISDIRKEPSEVDDGATFSERVTHVSESSTESMSANSSEGSVQHSVGDRSHDQEDSLNDIDMIFAAERSFNQRERLQDYVDGKHRRIARLQSAMDRIVTNETDKDQAWESSSLVIVAVKLSPSGYDLTVNYLPVHHEGISTVMSKSQTEALMKRMTVKVRTAIASKMDLKFAPRVHFEEITSKSPDFLSNQVKLDKAFEQIKRERTQK